MYQYLRTLDIQDFMIHEIKKKIPASSNSHNYCYFVCILANTYAVNELLYRGFVSDPL